MLREIGSPEQKVQTWAIWWYLLWHFWKARKILWNLGISVQKLCGTCRKTKGAKLPDLPHVRPNPVPFRSHSHMTHLIQLFGARTGTSGLCVCTTCSSQATRTWLSEVELFHMIKIQLPVRSCTRSMYVLWYSRRSYHPSVSCVCTTCSSQATRTWLSEVELFHMIKIQLPVRSCTRSMYYSRQSYQVLKVSVCVLHVVAKLHVPDCLKSRTFPYDKNTATCT